MWRPENWCYNGGNASDEFVGETYEAGADAMLEALRDEALKQEEAWQILVKELALAPMKKKERGRFLFIPEEG